MGQTRLPTRTAPRRLGDKSLGFTVLGIFFGVVKIESIYGQDKRGRVAAESGLCCSANAEVVDARRGLKQRV